MSFADLQRIFFKESKAARVTNFWNNLFNNAPEMTDVFVTLDIAFGDGIIHRLSTDYIDVLDDDGVIILYKPALEQEISLGISYTTGTSEAGVRSYSLTLDGRVIKPLDMVNNAIGLAGIAEIALQRKGQDYSQRFILMRGNMSRGVIFGNNDGFVEVEISDPKFVSNKFLPEYLITEEDFSTLPEDQRGQRFPVIVNQFRYVPCIRTSSYIYGTDFVVCQGHDVKINAVYVEGELKLKNDPDRGWSVKKGYTARGIAYTAINFSLPSTEDRAMQGDDSVYVYAENVVQRERNIIEQIREIVIIGTTFDSRFIDNYLFTSSAARCEALTAEICINGSGENDIAFGTEYIEQTLLPSFPMISMVYTGFGYGPVFTDRRINIRPITLERGQKYIFERVTEIQESPIENIFNKFTYRYNFNAMTNNFESVIELTPENNKLCEASTLQYGIREHQPIDSICVFDDPTANYIINWMAAHNTFPSYYVEYEGVAGLFFLLSLGDNILLTDDKLSFVDVECTVEKLEYQHSKCVIGLRMWLAYKVKTPSVASM